MNTASGANHSAAPGEEVRLSGILLVVGGMALLTLNDVVMKLLVGEMPLGQAVGLRGVAGCIVLALAAPWLGGIRALWPQSVRNVSILAGLLLIALFLFPWSLQRMPIADGIMLVSISPVIAAMMSPWLLGEHVGWRRWAAVALGLLGTAIVLNPIGGGANWAMLVPVFVAFLVAVRDILTRSYIAQEGALAIVFFSNLFSAIAGAFTLPFDAIEPSTTQWGYILATSVTMTIAMVMTTAAFHQAGAVTVSCLKYSAIIWAALLGWLVWGDRLSIWDWVGGGLITVSGIVIAIRTKI